MGVGGLSRTVLRMYNAHATGRMPPHQHNTTGIVGHPHPLTQLCHDPTGGVPSHPTPGKTHRAGGTLGRMPQARRPSRAQVQGRGVGQTPLPPPEAQDTPAQHSMAWVSAARHNRAQHGTTERSTDARVGPRPVQHSASQHRSAAQHRRPTQHTWTAAQATPHLATTTRRLPAGPLMVPHGPRRLAYSHCCGLAQRTPPPPPPPLSHHDVAVRQLLPRDIPLPAEDALPHALGQVGLSAQFMVRSQCGSHEAHAANQRASQQSMQEHPGRRGAWLLHGGSRLRPSPNPVPVAVRWVPSAPRCSGQAAPGQYVRSSRGRWVWFIQGHARSP